MKLPRIALENHQFTVTLYLALLILGVGAILTMPYSEDPPLDPPGATVIAFYPGASPLSMESLVVEPLEEAIHEIEDIKSFNVRIEDGVAKLWVEFRPGADADEKYNEVQEKVNKTRSRLPADLASLEAHKWSTSNVSIAQIALVSETRAYHEMHEEARRFKRLIERISGVKKVEILGAPAEIVRVDLRLDRLAAYHLSLNQVAGAIQAHNANIPGGGVLIGEKKFNLQPSGLYTGLEDIRRTVLHAPDGQPVRLEDVADVAFGHEDQTYRTRHNGRRCLFISVQQQKGTDIFRIADEVKGRMEAFRAQLPSGMALEMGFDESASVSSRIRVFGVNLLQGLVLVGLAIFLGVGSRQALIVLTAIPASILIGLGMVYLTGYGMHQMTIIGLIISLGMLTDNAVVVTENASRHQETGLKGPEAALKGTSEVAWPIVTSTLTTILGFLPIILMRDSTGDFIRSMPVTVIYTLTASLLVAVTLTPLLFARFSPEYRESRFLRWLRRWIETNYLPLMDRALRHRWATLGGVFALFVLSLCLFPLVGVSFFPKAEKPQFLVDVELPRGAHVDATDRVARQVEALLLRQPETQVCLTNVGRGNPQVYYNMPFTENKPYFAQMFVQVDEGRGRRVSQIVQDLRDQLEDLPSARVKVREFAQGPNTDAPIVIRVVGDHLQTLSRIAEDVEGALRATPGAIYVDNPLSVSRTDLATRISPDKAQILGLTPADVDRTVRAAVAGVTVSRYRDQGGQTYDIVLRLPVGDSPSIEDLDGVYLTSRSGAPVPLRQVADVSFKAGQTVISHYNLQRSVTLLADVQGRSVAEVTGEVVRKLNAYDWPQNYRYLVGGEQESRESSFGGLAQAGLIAIVCIFAVLVLQFRSFSQPFVIFSTVPLAIIGSILALLITGYSFSFTAFLGVTSLFGVVVNNGILLIDRINLQRQEGVDLLTAVKEAGASRFIPVLLTSITNMADLAPSALEGDTMWAPMAWAFIGGMSLSTALTLFVVPILYYVFSKSSQNT